MTQQWLSIYSYPKKSDLRQDIILLDCGWHYDCCCMLHGHINNEKKHTKPLSSISLFKSVKKLLNIIERVSKIFLIRGKLCLTGDEYFYIVFS